MAKYIAKFVQDEDMKGEVTIEASNMDGAMRKAEREYAIRPENVYQLLKVVFDRKIEL